MILKKQKIFDTPGSYWLAFSGALLFYALIQLKIAPDFFGAFHLTDIDDEMRLVMVRDLLNGQGWYDTVQHRALPPEGLPMHWSRLVDAPLVVLAWVYGLAYDQMTAIHLAAATWPVFLFVLYLLVIGGVMTAVFGHTQASFAVMGAAALPSVAGTFFPPGRVDHHNVQILTMAVALALVMRAERPVQRGILAGVTAALSLAVGLEAIVFFALLGVALTGLYIIDRPGAAVKLGGYGLGLGFAAPVFFLIQTPPQDWALLRCDQLSPMTLTMTASTAVFAVLCAMSRHRVRSRKGRLGLVLAMGAVILGVFWFSFDRCRAGSFSTMTPEISELIRMGISESISLQGMFEIDPAAAIQVALPYLVMAGALTALLLYDDCEGHRAEILIILTFILAAGIGLSYQIRTILWGHAAMPMAFGIVMGWFLGDYRKASRVAKPVLATVVFLLVLFPSIPVLIVSEAVTKRGAEPMEITAGNTGCFDAQAIAKLNGLPPSRILAPLDLGTKLLLYTDHEVFALPYHRRPEAYLNGLAFYGDEAGLEARLMQTDAEYVLVCTGQNYDGDDSIGTRLARGEDVDWLRAEGDAGNMRLYRRNIE